MSLLVRVTAACGEQKEVVVRVVDRYTNEVLSEQVLQEGETYQKNASDKEAVLSFERDRFIDEFPVIE